MENLVAAMDFWRGRRVLVTGHTGFKGAWLALWLTDMGAEVTGYALPAPTTPSLFELADVGALVTHIAGDVRDLPALTRAVRQARPEVVVHLAAQSLVRVSYDAPVETYATNVMGTVNLLEAVRQVGGARAVVCVTSDKCYENRETGRPYRESDPMGGHDPYSSSKGAAELVVSAWRRSFFDSAPMGEHGTLVATARAGNVIGGGDWAKDRLVPDLMTAFAAGRRPLIRFPASIRPWQHVLEPLAGYLNLAQRLWRGESGAAEAWNFGPDDADARPVAHIADRLAALWSDGAGWDATGDAQPHEAAYLKLDCSKAVAELEWRPQWPLDEALRRTVDWYRAFVEGADMAAFTRGQIQARLSGALAGQNIRAGHGS
ncbi:MAG TPA: CDP-glucose 4,6-dehydratase [Caulobacteraceae bacterium]